MLNYRGDLRQVLDSDKYIQPKKGNVFGVYQVHIYNYHMGDYQNDILDGLSAQEPRAEWF